MKNIEVQMARPRKNNGEYFSHDANMRNHRRVKALIAKFGFEGYGIWCMMLEVLTDSDFFEMILCEQEIILLSGDFTISSDRLKEIIDYCIKLNLLQNENGKLFSRNHKKRMSPLQEKRERERKKRQPNSDGPPKLSQENNTESRSDDSVSSISETDTMISETDSIQRKENQNEVNEIKGEQVKVEKGKKKKSNESEEMKKLSGEGFRRVEFSFLTKWIADKCKNVCKMNEGLTERSFDSLIKEYSLETIKQYLLKLNDLLFPPNYKFNEIDSVFLAICQLTEDGKIIISYRDKNK